MHAQPHPGDYGETLLGNGQRTSKADPRVVAYGEVDELNSILGWCRCQSGSDELDRHLGQFQDDLFRIGAELALPAEAANRLGDDLLDASRIGRVEQLIEQAVNTVEPIRHFILPTGTELACRLHIARAVCRRAERAVVNLMHTTEANAPTQTERMREEVLMYLNRLSTLLFDWARLVNQQAGQQDTPWKMKP